MLVLIHTSQPSRSAAASELYSKNNLNLTVAAAAAAAADWISFMNYS
jgi:hypothetical protein